MDFQSKGNFGFYFNTKVSPSTTCFPSPHLNTAHSLMEVKPIDGNETHSSEDGI